MATVAYAAAEDESTLWRSCVTCGQMTGGWCEGRDNQCFAGSHYPGAEVWSPGQRTPLCTTCDKAHGECRFCRGIHMAQPPPRGPAKPRMPARHTGGDLWYFVQEAQVKRFQAEQ